MQLGELGAALSPLSGREGGAVADDPATADGDCGATAAPVGQGEAVADELVCVLPAAEWNAVRIARLAYLVGLGKTAAEISFDDIVRATPNAIYKMMARLGLKFRDVPEIVAVRISDVERAALRVEANRRKMTPEALVGHVVKVCICDKLYGAILDR